MTKRVGSICDALLGEGLVVEKDRKKEMIDIVKDMNSGYDNETEPELVKTFEVGPVRIHTFGFRGEDKRWYENYVTDYRGDLRGFQYLWDAIPEINKGFSLTNQILGNLRAVAIAIVSLALVGTVCYLAVTGVQNELLFNLAALTIGYLAGKGEAQLVSS